MVGMEGGQVNDWFLAVFFKGSYHPIFFILNFFVGGIFFLFSLGEEWKKRRTHFLWSFMESSGFSGSVFQRGPKNMESNLCL